MAASRTVLRSASIFLMEPYRPVHFSRASSSIALGTSRSFTHRLNCNVTTARARGFHFRKRTVLNCSHDETQSTSSSNQDGQGPPQEAVLKAISEVSKTEGRVGHTTNMVIGGTVTDDSTNEWIALDQKGKVRHKLSSKGKYVSVNIGPVQVISSEQVQAVYNAMKRDDRMKYFL
ncbi:uncharacterized protein LOC111019651 isoform X2 [Momordica charantia]|uniref:Uncharacterized protein LOC111019651 isoform X2 n=1 Tax=Momordica charantia TaxID=3673 RepID=A0A6J1DFL3_MOMCH|nr:uncharacterized protein LOC111019651 isoform X2 [Momordica charantia]